MSIISSVPPNGTISGPLPGSLQQATPVVNAAGGGADVARNLLPSAVIASNLVPAFQEPRNTKVTLRVASNAPSSQLAAQYLSQAPEASEDELAIFTPPNKTPQQETIPEDAFLAALRNARGDAAQAPANSNIPAAALAQAAQTAQSTTQIATTNILNFATTATAVATAPKPAAAQELRGLPQVQTNSVGRKPGLSTARGASAYQLAEARNEASGRLSAGIDAIL